MARGWRVGGGADYALFRSKRLERELSPMVQEALWSCFPKDFVRRGNVLSIRFPHSWWERARQMTDDPVMLKAVESFIDARQKALAFPSWLERQFELDMRERRSQRLQANTLHMMVVYNLFLFGDWLLVPDRMVLALALHFLIVTPWMLFVAWLMRSMPGKVVREGAAATLPVAIVLQIMCVFDFSNSPYVNHYQYFVLLPVLFTNTIQRLPFQYGAVVSGCIVACQGATIIASGHMPGPVGVMASVTLAACAYTTLFSNFYLERDFRRSYLHGLRDRLRLVEADAESRRDALTDLANRHSLNARIAQIWQGGDDTNSPVAVILLDIDYFKAFNDRYGHPAGDACLKRVAACVKAELRNDGDLAVRYGGEEFLLMLPRTEMIDAVRVAERIRRAIEALGIPHDGAVGRRSLTVSLGVTAAPVLTLSAEELVAAADTALYAAKRNGRNQVCPPLLRDRTSPPTDSGAVIVPMKG
jgi:diguanylate cyclase (GGDEF)-like protein